MPKIPHDKHKNHAKKLKVYGKNIDFHFPPESMVRTLVKMLTFMDGPLIIMFCRLFQWQIKGGSCYEPRTRWNLQLASPSKLQVNRSCSRSASLFSLVIKGYNESYFSSFLWAGGLLKTWGSRFLTGWGLKCCDRQQ